MLIRSLALTSLCALLTVPLSAQQEASSTKRKQSVARAEAAFYKAYFTEKDLKRKPEAIALYREFLGKAPKHELAGQAARYASALLENIGKKDEARALRTKHAAIIAATLQDGINASFLDPKTNVNRFVQRFETESREIFKHRQKILDLVGLRPGQAVADIGAGTGLYSLLFAHAVGSEGKAYAVDIGPVMVRHLRRLAKKEELPQIEVVHCDERSSKLPASSVDKVFICDTYHHFSHPKETMASIHKALRPGGELILIDFHRIEGKSRGWIMNHVRAGQEVFRAEIEAAGFRFRRADDVPFLTENYMIRFVRE